MMKKMNEEKMMNTNGGFVAKSQPCPYCGRVFKRNYYEFIGKVIAEGRVAIDLRTHIYDCCLNYC